ncbi:Protein GST-6 [Aphelenchoides avenae]|nr:Protein GST-6 [Aphelenchus avenae]
MPDYKLLYLPFRGRAESIALMLHHLQVPYTDGRWNPELEWSKVKSSTPFGKGPVLVVDDELYIAHTTAILRYLARHHGFAYGDEKLDLQVEMYGEQIQDYIMALMPWATVMLGFGPETEKSKTCVPETLKDAFGPVYEKQLKKTGTGFIVGNKLTWADFQVAAFTECQLKYAKAYDHLKDFPLILKHRDMVFSLPNIQVYLKNRQETPF